jgi:hypothetical protein
MAKRKSESSEVLFRGQTGIYRFIYLSLMRDNIEEATRSHSVQLLWDSSQSDPISP